jgi:hypothetical protein
MKFHRIPWTKFERGVPAEDPVGGQIFINSRYQVSMRGIFTHPTDSYFGPFIELSIKRRDKEKLLDWRDMQLIKNELVGPEATMVQVFPPERHLVDTSNQYYFYAFWERELPFGFKERMVSAETGRQTHPAHPGVNKQAPFEPHQIPATMEEDRARYEAAVQELQQVPWDQMREHLKAKV